MPVSNILDADSDDAWHSLLADYHLTEKDLYAHVQQQIDVMRLVDARLRPAVQIDSKSIEAYYRDQFVPKLKQAGASEVPLVEVSAKIRELLTSRKLARCSSPGCRLYARKVRSTFPALPPRPTIRECNRSDPSDSDRSRREARPPLVEIPAHHGRRGVSHRPRSDHLYQH